MIHEMIYLGFKLRLYILAIENVLLGDYFKINLEFRVF